MGNLRVHAPAALGVMLAAAVSLGADVPLSEVDADRCARKLLTITQYGLVHSREPRVTSLTEAEVNSYLTYRAGSQIPTGIIEPYVGLAADGRLDARATVDLDAVRAEHESAGWLDPMNFLAGRLPVTATAVLTTTGGTGRLTLESATVSGVPVPKALLQEMVSYYTRSPERPEGFSLDEPFDLPMRIRMIKVEAAEAVVVQ